MTTTPTIERLSGPAQEPIPLTYDLEALGYVDEEFVLSGSADSYVWRGDKGSQAVASDSAAFSTRLIVRRPSEASLFSGTVVIEWLNVSAGMDVGPEWNFLHRHLIRRGHAWVGVSAQRAGIEGGGVIGGSIDGLPLKLISADRYENLSHPGDAWSYDIFSQVGRLLRSPGGGLLGGAVAEGLLAVGESQSAAFLVTYVNAVDPLVGVFDGFLIHGRASAAAGLRGDLPGTDMNGDLAQAAHVALTAEPEPIRSDARVPVLVLQSETDTALFGGGRIVQPNEDKVRVWEIAGSAHADTYLAVAALNDDGSSVERLAQDLRPVSEVIGSQTASLINSGPQQHYVAQAAIEHLDRWAAGGPTPPIAPRLQLADTGDDIHRDSNGIALGGLRTPWVDVPVATLSGFGQTGDAIGLLFGSTTPIEPAAIASMYPEGRSDYLSRFTAALDATITAGFILQEDRDEILGIAAANFPRVAHI